MMHVQSEHALSIKCGSLHVWLLVAISIVVLQLEHALICVDVPKTMQPMVRRLVDSADHAVHSDISAG